MYSASWFRYNCASHKQLLGKVITGSLFGQQRCLEAGSVEAAYPAASSDLTDCVSKAAKPTMLPRSAHIVQLRVVQLRAR